MNDFTVSGTIAKTDEPRRLVFGWASVAEDGGGLVVDKQGDMISPEELEKAAYQFVLFKRDAGEMHRRVGVGVLVESLVTTLEKQRAMGLEPGTLPVGWWVGFRVDPDIFAKIQSGEYRAFSIHGVGRRTERT